MSIKPPEWFPNAIPTYDGWINPENKELLVRAPYPANYFTQQQIDEYEAHRISKKQAEEQKAIEEIEKLKGAQIKVRKQKKKSVKRKNK